jgi:uncharacterized membrane protein
MLAAQQTEKKPKLLLASIILNIFLLGCFAGGAYHLFWSEHATFSKNYAKNQTGLRFAAENLSDEQQERFRESIRQTRRNARPIIMQGIEARRHLHELLKAPAFDRDAISAEITKVRESDVAVRIKIEENLVTFAETLTTKERLKLAEGLANKGPLRERIVPLN